MTTPKDNGGPAYPCPYSLPENQGVTVRDYFAAKAMLGFITEPVAGIEAPLYVDLGNKTCSVLAEAAYTVADAMLKERAK